MILVQGARCWGRSIFDLEVTDKEILPQQETWTISVLGDAIPNASLGEQVQVGAGRTEVKKEEYCCQSSGTQVWSHVKSPEPLGHLLPLEGNEDAPRQGRQWFLPPAGLEFPKSFLT